LLAKDFINADIQPISPGDTVDNALELMDNSRLQDIPIVENGTFRGIANGDQIASNPNYETILSDLPAIGIEALVYDEQHIFDVLKAGSIANSTVVAVQDRSAQYIGTIALADVAKMMGKGLSLNTPGAILVLSVTSLSYSAAEIARLVEGNNAKVLFSFVEADPEDAAALVVTLRINQLDISRIVATFERFGYLVVAKFHQSDAPDFDQERLDGLLNYLNI
jgi:acetoin utilization protein AcuB